MKISQVGHDSRAHQVRQFGKRGGGGSRLLGWWRARTAAARRDTGMSTTEYAMGTIAAAAFAAVLYKVLTSGTVSKALESVIGKALDAPF
ncbi:DUF4244 domain-containing protein [Streptomyces sp. NPDC012637]|uniref:DUF4244 domain-containing protein n=1 Tax=Streptomyces sp. NPDC012637 TaxID=3364842 RepID=UPI0036E2407F